MREEFKTGVRLAVFSMVYTLLTLMGVIGLIKTGGIRIEVQGPQYVMQAEPANEQQNFADVEETEIEPEEVAIDTPSAPPAPPAPPAPEVVIKAATESIRTIGPVVSPGLPEGITARAKEEERFTTILLEGTLGTDDAKKFVDLVTGGRAEIMLLDQGGFTIGVQMLAEQDLRMTSDGMGGYKVRQQTPVVCEAGVIASVEIIVPQLVPSPESQELGSLDEEMTAPQGDTPQKLGVPHESHEG